MTDEKQAQTAATLGDIKVTLSGVLIELQSKQKRDFQTTDFVIEEFRRLVRSIDRLTDVLERP